MTPECRAEIIAWLEAEGDMLLEVSKRPPPGLPAKEFYRMAEAFKFVEMRMRVDGPGSLSEYLGGIERQRAKDGKPTITEEIPLSQKNEEDVLPDMETA